MRVKLGRIKSPHDDRDLRLSKLLKPNLPAPPFAGNYDRKVARKVLPIWGNDTVGNCAFAAQAAHILTWTANATGIPYTASTSEVNAAYSAVTGFTVGKPQTDRGTHLRDALKWWQNYGIGGYKITAYVRVNPSEVDLVKQAIWLFGGLYVGAQLPKRCQNSFGAWDNRGNAPEDRPNSWGGHAMSLAHYDAQGVYFKTWGRYQYATWAWWQRYVDEVWCVIGPTWRDASAYDASELDRMLESI